MSDRRVVCYACSHEHVFEGTVARSATCDRCRANLRCCRNCRFYDPIAYNECAEPAAERVVDKLAATFCDLYDPRAVPAAAVTSGSDAKSELERLFGKK